MSSTNKIYKGKKTKETILKKKKILQFSSETQKYTKNFTQTSQIYHINSLKKYVISTSTEAKKDLVFCF